LKAGESVINSTISQLSSTKYPSFEAFKAAREKAAASVHAQLQKNVAYPELSESFLKSLEDLSTKKGLEFNLSKNEREKENVIMAQSRKNVEQQKKSQEFEESTMNSQQVQKNLDTERRLLQEQNEKQEREWKSRIDLEAQLRQQQIAADLKSGFEERAKSLHEEMNASNQQQMMMMMQMQKESKEQQDKLTQLLTMEMNKQPPPPPPRPAGLLSTILAPVANFLGKLL
jgi:membrane-bound lytic murein transglycosylase